MDSTSETPEASTNTQDSVESAADVQQSTIELVEKHKSRKQRSDKGQKRGPRGTNQEAQVPLQNIDPALQLNLELVKKSIAAIVKTGDAIVVRRIYSKARRLGCDDALGKEYALAAGITADEQQIISECSAVIMARSEWMMRHAPEAMLGCVVVSYSVRVLTVMNRLDKLEQELKEQTDKKKAA